jgi:hypothetical protein
LPLSSLASQGGAHAVASVLDLSGGYVRVALGGRSRGCGRSLGWMNKAIFDEVAVLWAGHLEAPWPDDLYRVDGG